MILTPCPIPTRRTATTTGPAVLGKLQPCPTTASALWALPLGAGLQVLLPPSSAGEGGDCLATSRVREGVAPNCISGQRKKPSPLKLLGSKGNLYFQTSLVLCHRNSSPPHTRWRHLESLVPQGSACWMGPSQTVWRPSPLTSTIRSMTSTVAGLQEDTAGSRAWHGCVVSCPRDIYFVYFCPALIITL